MVKVKVFNKLDRSRCEQAMSDFIKEAKKALSEAPSENRPQNDFQENYSMKGREKE